MNFPEKLKKLRKENNLTQEEVASKIYVSRTLVTKYENGTIDPTKENLEKLAKLFNVEVDYLLDNEDTIELALKNKEVLDRINFVMKIVILVISGVFILLSLLPIFSARYFDYSHGTPPAIGFINHSLIYLTLNNSNPIALITIISLVFDSSLVIYSFIKKERTSPYIYLIIYILLVINIFLIFFSVVFGISYCSSNIYDYA